MSFGLRSSFYRITPLDPNAHRGFRCKWVRKSSGGTILTQKRREETLPGLKRIKTLEEAKERSSPPQERRSMPWRQPLPTPESLWYLLERHGPGVASSLTVR